MSVLSTSRELRQTCLRVRKNEVMLNYRKEVDIFLSSIGNLNHLNYSKKLGLQIGKPSKPKPTHLMTKHSYHIPSVACASLTNFVSKAKVSTQAPTHLYTKAKVLLLTWIQMQPTNQSATFQKEILMRPVNLKFSGQSGLKTRKSCTEISILLWASVTWKRSTELIYLRW